MTSLHAFVNASVWQDAWSTPKDAPCGVCGVTFGVHGSFNSFSAPGLDEVACTDIFCLYVENSMHTMADHTINPDGVTYTLPVSEE